MSPVSPVTRSSRHVWKLALGEELNGEHHNKPVKKRLESFLSYITFHLLMVFRHNSMEAVKYSTTNTIKKPKQVLVHQFFKHIEQFNGYLKIPLCLYYSPKANIVTKPVEPLDDSHLATHLLCM